MRLEAREGRLREATPAWLGVVESATQAAAATQHSGVVVELVAAASRVGDFGGGSRTYPWQWLGA